MLFSERSRSPAYVELGTFPSEPDAAVPTQHDVPLPRSSWLNRARGKGSHALAKPLSSWEFCLLPRWRDATGWQSTVLLGAATALFVLVVNVILLAWASTKHINAITGDRSIFEGSCSRMQTTFTWSHLGINVLLSLLLGSSNFAIQCLSAPTREDIDRVHKKCNSLDTGISGFLNWKVMAWWRKSLWIFFLLTSLPLHLL